MRSLKWLNLLFFLMFLIAAFLQLNDPDPEIWFSLYLSGAAFCVFALFGNIDKALLWTALIIYLSYAGYLLLSPDGVISWYFDHGAENIAQSMKAEKPWIEASREFFGLLILSAAVGLNLHFRRKNRTQSKSV